MEFRILGPVELWSGDHRHAIGRAKERCVLAVLALTPGVPVSTDKLMESIWDGHVPRRARADIHTYVSRLRKVISSVSDEVKIESIRSGRYVLRIDSNAIDLHEFRDRRKRARAIADSGDHGHALELLRDAMALVRGRPLEGLSGVWADTTRRHIEEELLTATLERIEFELLLGHHAELISELRVLVGEHPLDERLAGQLMVALYRSGRQADALAVYPDIRGRLNAELGAEPGQDLVDLHQRILRGDRTLLPVPRAQPAVIDPPDTLLDDIPHFTGREEEIEALLEMASPTRPGRPAVIGLSGMPGVGKTVLAVHLAHRLAAEYPDGRLYLNLHALEETVVSPASALDELLRMLGIQSGPRSVEELSALWRAELAGRRILVVLDNAGWRDQVQPLLAPAPGCLTLVTSRRRLVGLDDVWSYALEELTPTDAARLFERTVGPARVSSPDDLATVVALCGH